MQAATRSETAGSVAEELIGANLDSFQSAIEPERNELNRSIDAQSLRATDKRSSVGEDGRRKSQDSVGTGVRNLKQTLHARRQTQRSHQKPKMVLANNTSSVMGSSGLQNSTQGLEIVGSNRKTYLGMPMESELAGADKASKSPKLQKHLKHLNDQIELEITAYQTKVGSGADATHRPLQMRPLQHHSQAMAHSQGEHHHIAGQAKPTDQLRKKTDLLLKLNYWQKERTQNALINQNVNKQRGPRATFEIQPASGGLQIIRQALPSLPDSDNLHSMDEGSLTNRQLGASLKQRVTASQEAKQLTKATVATVATGRSTRHSFQAGAESGHTPSSNDTGPFQFRVPLQVAAGARAAQRVVPHSVGGSRVPQNVGLPMHKQVSHQIGGQSMDRQISLGYENSQESGRRSSPGTVLLPAHLHMQQQMSSASPTSSFMQMSRQQAATGPSYTKTQQLQLGNRLQELNQHHPSESFASPANASRQAQALAASNLQDYHPVSQQEALFQQHALYQRHLQQVAALQHHQSILQSNAQAAGNAHQNQMLQASRDQQLTQGRAFVQSESGPRQRRQAETVGTITSQSPPSAREGAIHGLRTQRPSQLQHSRLSQNQFSGHQSQFVPIQSGPKSIRFERVSVSKGTNDRAYQTYAAGHPQGSVGWAQSPPQGVLASGQRNAGQNRAFSPLGAPNPNGRREMVSSTSSGQRQMKADFAPSVNRMLVDLKKLDYFSDPNSVLLNLRATLEECSKKQRQESVTKLQKIQLGTSSLSHHKREASVSRGVSQSGTRSEESVHASPNSHTRHYSTALFTSSAANKCTSCNGHSHRLGASNSQVQTQQYLKPPGCQTVNRPCHCACQCHAHVQARASSLGHNDHGVTQQVEMASSRPARPMNQQFIVTNGTSGEYAPQNNTATQSKDEKSGETSSRLSQLVINSPLRIPLGNNQTQVIVPHINLQSEGQALGEQHLFGGAQPDLGAFGGITDRMGSLEASPVNLHQLHTTQTTDRIGEQAAQSSGIELAVQPSTDSHGVRPPDSLSQPGLDDDQEGRNMPRSHEMSAQQVVRKSKESLLSLSQQHDNGNLEGGKYAGSTALDANASASKQLPGQEALSAISDYPVAGRPVRQDSIGQAQHPHVVQTIQSGEVDQRAGQTQAVERKTVYVPISGQGHAQDAVHRVDESFGKPGAQLMGDFYAQTSPLGSVQGLTNHDQLLQYMYSPEMTNMPCNPPPVGAPGHVEMCHNPQCEHGPGIDSVFGPPYACASSRLEEENEEDLVSNGLLGEELASHRSIKEHHSRIQMDYYEEPRQYNALNNQHAIKFPTHTNLLATMRTPQTGVLKFGSQREHADIDVSLMAYQDQKEFFRLDRLQDQVLLEQHSWKTKKTLNQVGKALEANLRKERMNIFRQFLNDSKRQQINMNHLCISSRIPKVALTDKSAALQNSQIRCAAEKSRPEPSEIADHVQRRFRVNEQQIRRRTSQKDQQLVRLSMHGGMGTRTSLPLQASTQEPRIDKKWPVRANSTGVSPLRQRLTDKLGYSTPNPNPQVSGGTNLQQLLLEKRINRVRHADQARQQITMSSDPYQSSSLQNSLRMGNRKSKTPHAGSKRHKIMKGITSRNPDTPANIAAASQANRKKGIVINSG